MTETHDAPDESNRRVQVHGVLLNADDIDVAQLLGDLAGTASTVPRDLLRREWTITASDLNARMPLTPTRRNRVGEREAARGKGNQASHVLKNCLRRLEQLGAVCRRDDQVAILDHALLKEVVAEWDTECPRR